MTPKPLPFAAEVLCSFKTVSTAPLSPFVWVLLKTLKTFPRGGRPDWEELATKLAVGEPSFFSAAWVELCDLNLVNNAYFPEADLRESGEAALVDGFVRNEFPRQRHRERLYFRLNNGEPFRWRHDLEPKNHARLFKPDWAAQVTEQVIRETLAEQRQSSDEHVQPDEKIYDLEIHWDESSKVKLD
jgi:hypothetical protein